MVETFTHSPEHQCAVGRVVIAGSSIESVVANIAARLLLDPAEGIKRFAGRPFDQVLKECRKLACWPLPAQRSDNIPAASLQDNVLGRLDRAGQEANRRNAIVHATRLRVNKPLPGTVAYVHFGADSGASGSAWSSRSRWWTSIRWAWRWRVSSSPDYCLLAWWTTFSMPAHKALAERKANAWDSWLNCPTQHQMRTS
jgi:hypothetical protein